MQVAEMLESEFLHVLTSEHDQSELKGIIGRCSFFIGSRMHSCIAALSQGIPTIGIAYSKKFSGVFESIGAEHLVIDCRNKTNSVALDEIMKIYENKNNIANDLKDKVKQVQVKIIEAFSLIFDSDIKND